MNPHMNPVFDNDPSPIDPMAVVAVYNSHEKAEAAIKKLQQGGFDMTRLSVVGRDYHTDEHVVGYYNVGDRMKYWGKLGALWGGLWGLLVGAAFFWVPGIGPTLIAGPLVAACVGALESAAVVGGVGVLGAALYSIGIPKDSLLTYETAIKAGKYLLVAHGTVAEIDDAKSILGRTQPANLEAHSLLEAQPVQA